MLVMMLRTVTLKTSSCGARSPTNSIGGRPPPGRLLVEPLQRPWGDLIAQPMDQLHEKHLGTSTPLHAAEAPPRLVGRCGLQSPATGPP